MNVAFLGADLPRWDQLLREQGVRPSCLGLPFFEDERPLRGVAGLCDWRLGGRLSRLLGASGTTHLRGTFGDKLLLPTGARLPFGRLILFGLGTIAAFDEKRAREASRSLVTALAALVDPAEAEAAIALVPPGRSTGALSARRALELVLEEVPSLVPDSARLVIVESVAGQKEAAELVRRTGAAEIGPP